MVSLVGAPGSWPTQTGSIQAAKKNEEFGSVSERTLSCPWRTAPSLHRLPAVDGSVGLTAS
jgi:hypothetical protein